MLFSGTLVGLTSPFELMLTKDQRSGEVRSAWQLHLRLKSSLETIEMLIEMGL